MELSAEKFTIAALLLGMLLLMGIQTMNFHRQMDKLEDTVRRLQRQGPPTAVAAGGRLRALQVADEEARNDTFAAIASEWSTTDYGVLRFDDTIISTKEYLEGIDLFDLLTIDLHDLYKLEGLVVSFGNGSRFEAMQKLAQVFRDYDAPMIEIYFQSGDRIVVGKEGAAFFDKSDLRTPQALFEGPEMPDGTTGPELIDILNGTYQAMQKELFNLFTINEEGELDIVGGNGEDNGTRRLQIQDTSYRWDGSSDRMDVAFGHHGLGRMAKTIDLNKANMLIRANTGRCGEGDRSHCIRRAGLN
uniref:Uncharacterized protein n=1 Tax=Vitrella brassicaformis TaxID=1169539 RepID=A0A7S1JUP5_9ALVE|mmetsp:Transcript_25741/g.63824  ORF Transcript_25741/g.63824 Transcript_25741/m.63824 type:complete len:302 (+) Transcript_25741:133-1038(+)